jgi:signal transduction histidine kinase
MLDDHTPFLEKGIPAVDIIDFDYPYWHTTADTPDKVSPESLQAVGDTLWHWVSELMNGEITVWSKAGTGRTLKGMAVQTSLKKIRTIWVERISRELAAGEGVRAGFTEQLERFYDLLEQTIVTGDTAWLDPILYDWGRSPTETNLEQADYNVSFVLNRMITLTIEDGTRTSEKQGCPGTPCSCHPSTGAQLECGDPLRNGNPRCAHLERIAKLVQEKLQTLDQNKSKFISVAAHELKTPLTLIEGYTSMMADMVQNSEQAR